jgi:hypothetical protein
VDFSERSLAGRFGEAIAYLTMLKWGYIYWDRIAVLWERAAAHSRMTHPERVRRAQVIAKKISKGRPDLEPDFAFEKASGDVALMESKGSFVHPIKDTLTTKQDLKHALEQLQCWGTMISPTPAKSYAIGTYFRDQSDVTGDPSLIAYVDPPGESDKSALPVRLPEDWIRRGNYGAWLVGMGFAESGNSLRRGDAMELPERLLPTVVLGSRRFVVRVEGVTLKRKRSYLSPFMLPWVDLWFADDDMRFQLPRAVLRQFGVAGIRVTGIESDTLRLIEKAVRLPDSQALMLKGDTRGTFVSNEQLIPDAEGISGSVFPDGTLYAQIDPELLLDAETEAFQL